MKHNGGLGIEFEEGSGNVFADLGLADADAQLSRAKLGFHDLKQLRGAMLRPLLRAIPELGRGAGPPGTYPASAVT